MGGGNKDKDDDTTGSGDEGKTAYGRLPGTQTFQPHLPGMQGMIASQLQQGFGGQGLGDVAGMLSKLYKPMNVTTYKEPISTTAAQWDNKKYLDAQTGNPILDLLLMGKGPNKETDGEDEDEDQPWKRSDR